MSQHHATATTTDDGTPPVNPEVSAMARVSISTWLLIITLIATIGGFGAYIRAAQSDISSLKTAVDAVESKKADKRDVDRQFRDVVEERNRQYDDIVHRLDDLKTDIREVRAAQQPRQSNGGNR